MQHQPKIPNTFLGESPMLGDTQLLHNKSGSGTQAFNLRFQEAIIKATTHSPVTISNRDPGPLKDPPVCVFSRFSNQDFPPVFRRRGFPMDFFRFFHGFWWSKNPHLKVISMPGGTQRRTEQLPGGWQQPSTNGWQLSPTSPCPSSFWSAQKIKNNLLWKRYVTNILLFLHV